MNPFSYAHKARKNAEYCAHKYALQKHEKIETSQLRKRNKVDKNFFVAHSLPLNVKVMQLNSTTFVFSFQLRDSTQTFIATPAYVDF